MIQNFLHEVIDESFKQLHMMETECRVASEDTMADMQKNSTVPIDAAFAEENIVAKETVELPQQHLRLSIF